MGNIAAITIHIFLINMMRKQKRTVVSSYILSHLFLGFSKSMIS